MRFWRHLVQRFSHVLFALSIVLFGMGAPLYAAPAAATQSMSASSHCTDSSSAIVNLPIASDCLSHCALPVPLATTASVTQIQSQRPAAPLIAWQAVSIAPPSPPPRSTS